jgi:hypothetical protein
MPLLLNLATRVVVARETTE